MKVFNPGSVPVVIDDGVVVPAAEHAEIADGPMARAAIERDQLLDQTDAGATGDGDVEETDIKDAPTRPGRR